MIVPAALLAIFALAFSAPIEESLNRHWEAYKTTHKKVYAENEELLRRIIWEKNLKTIRYHNLEADMGKHTYWLGMNNYGDMAHEEFLKKMISYTMEKKINGSLYLAPSNVKLPFKVDWRKKGYVTPVKNQGQCGSCWTYGVTGSLEGQHFRKTKKLVPLSEQNIIDCSRGFGNNGCKGGTHGNTWRYIISNGGIDTEESYPYEAKDNVCRFKIENVGATCYGFKTIPSGDEDALKSAVATVGPIAVAVDAGYGFPFYRYGVYNNPRCSQTERPHSVLVVGYGTSLLGKPYWLVKNSWGKSWGRRGYILMSRNKNNQCGIARDATYPLV